VRGAFTGADDARQGLLELADGATVFFDEAGDIPRPVQVKLLRVLEQHEVTPVGCGQARTTAFRVISATNRDLRSAPDETALRRDLFFRLAAFEIALPPLRERLEDIPLLAEHFLARVDDAAQGTKRFTAQAMSELCRRTWPGNVRQLRHAVEHGALLARGGRIVVEHLPPPTDDSLPRSPAGQLNAAVCGWTHEQLAKGAIGGQLYQMFLAQVEPPLFETVLRHTAGNRAAAADSLGMHRATLRKKLNGNSHEQ
jgi:two-component system nitrogen regulation response regulator GlnG